MSELDSLLGEVREIRKPLTVDLDLRRRDIVRQYIFKDHDYCDCDKEKLANALEAVLATPLKPNGNGGDILIGFDVGYNHAVVEIRSAIAEALGQVTP